MNHISIIFLTMGLFVFVLGFIMWAQVTFAYKRIEANPLPEVAKHPHTFYPPCFKSQREIYQYLIAGGAVTHQYDTRVRIEFNKDGKMTAYSTFHDPRQWRKV